MEEIEDVLWSDTGAATHISCRNAVLSGGAHVPSVAAADMTFGVLYSTNSGITIDSGVQVKAESFDEKYNYSVTTEALEPDTKYYYRAYVLQAGIVTYGETKSFTTLPLSSMIQTLDATDINPKDAVLNAKLDLTDCVYTSLSYGFEYSQQGGSKQSIWSSNLSDKSFSAKTVILTRETQYEYGAFVEIDGKTYNADPKTFSTSTLRATVSLGDVTEITADSAIINGQLKIESQGSFSSSGMIYYSSEVSGLESLKQMGNRRSFDLPKDGSFSVPLKQSVIARLSSDTRYNYAVVITVDGVEFSKEGTPFTTKTINASVTTGGASLTPSYYLSGSLSGFLTVSNAESLGKSVGFLYGTTQNTIVDLKASGTWVDSKLGSEGEFTSNLSNLSLKTTYYYVAVAKVHDKEFYGEIKTFTTPEFAAFVWTKTASGISATGVTMNGQLHLISMEALSPSVCFLYSDSQPTLAGLKSSGTEVNSAPDTYGAFASPLSNLTPNTTYYYVAVAIVRDKEYYGEVETFTTLGEDVVDLGLSVKWRSWNMGATKPEEYGDYYAWGETEPNYMDGHSQDNPCINWRDGKTGYTWGSYKWCNGTDSSMTKYCTNRSYGSVDNKTVLDPEDDVAHVKLGGKWRTPTDAEWTELRNSCTWTWTRNYNGTGVAGRIVTSKKTGYTDKSIFLPAAGCRYNTNLCDVGSNGGYWSSSLNTGSPYCACEVFFDSGGVYSGSSHRYAGSSVRPVME
ncbi:MAG: hypothetical protein IJV01_04425 [Bacteroidales bacterium]|nr:hypothetical protein [Bacteroidales bacterium]